jgi:eukaryotic-like serine/threonine-protein kinase
MTPTPGRVAPGVILLGKYQVERIIGRGGMALVVEATDLSLDRRVALKVLDPTLATDAEFVTRFYRESRVMARLDHPHIVPVYAVMGEGELHFIVMKLLTGTALSAFTRSPQPPTWVLNILRQVCPALDYLHQRGFIHRDVKPGNVFLDAGRNVTLLDLGVVRRSDGGQLTRPGIIMGTPAYMAPEQLLEPDTIDYRIDLYSLGVMTYHLLTGRLPFEAGQLTTRLTSSPPLVSALCPEIAPGVARAVASLMDVEREERPPSAAAFFSAFVRAVANSGVRPGDEETPTESLTTTEDQDETE